MHELLDEALMVTTIAHFVLNKLCRSFSGRGCCAPTCRDAQEESRTLLSCSSFHIRCWPRIWEPQLQQKMVYFHLCLLGQFYSEGFPGQGLTAMLLHQQAGKCFICALKSSFVDVAGGKALNGSGG